MSDTQTTLTRTIGLTRVEEPEHLALGLQEMHAALPDYQMAEDYYTGKRGEEFAHPRIARALQRTKGRYKVNFAKTPVNVVADRMVISSVTVKQRSTEKDLTKEFERLVWVPCKMEHKTAQINLKMCEYGDSYAFVWPKTETHEETGEEVSTDEPAIYFNNPKTTRMIYDPEAPDEPLFVIKKWKSARNRWRCNLYYPDRIEMLILKANLKNDSSEALDPKNWEVFAEPEPNPYKRLPIFHFHNDDPYGVPEHYDGYGSQDAINKMSTTMVHTTEYMGFPQRYGLAHPNAEIAGDGMNNTSKWDDEEDANEETQDDTGTETGPGTFLKLEGIASAGTFAPAEAEAFLKPTEFYIRALAQTTTTPLRYFYPPGAHPPSGESYRAEDTPLINKVKKREKSVSDEFQDMCAFAMEVATDIPAKDLAVEIKWAPAASIDDALGWETVVKKIEAGVPRRQALIEAGYTADQVDEWIKNNQDRATQHRDITDFAVFAAAAKNSADAAELNAINPESLALVLTGILQGFAPEGKKLALPEPKEEVPPQLQNNPPPNSGFPHPGPPNVDIPQRAQI